jgi:UDP-2,3-diacylglucosamine pyrophosphatase LpxH
VLLRGSADVVVMGHLHVPAIVRLEEGPVVHLGGWVDQRCFLVVEGGRACLRTADEQGRWSVEPLAELGLPSEGDAS